MPRVNLQTTLSEPVVPARSAASGIILDVVEQRGEWAMFSLFVQLRTLGLPDVGHVAIPVVLYDVSETLEPRFEIRFKLRARRSPESFPTFDGALGVDASGPSSATLWLAGEYTLPAQKAGLVFDSIFGRGTAEKALRNMLNELAEAIVARVEKRELASARYRLLSTGD